MTTAIEIAFIPVIAAGVAVLAFIARRLRSTRYGGRYPGFSAQALRREEHVAEQVIEHEEPRAYRPRRPRRRLRAFFALIAGAAAVYVSARYGHFPVHPDEVIGVAAAVIAYRETGPRRRAIRA